MNVFSIVLVFIEKSTIDSHANLQANILKTSVHLRHKVLHFITNNLF